jgi:hypothetical protein
MQLGCIQLIEQKLKWIELRPTNPNNIPNMIPTPKPGLLPWLWPLGEILIMQTPLNFIHNFGGPENVYLILTHETFDPLISRMQTPLNFIITNSRSEKAQKYLDCVLDPLNWHGSGLAQHSGYSSRILGQA